MPIGGKLLLKGGVPLKGGVKKKHKHKAKPAADDEGADAADAEQQQQQQQPGAEGGQPPPAKKVSGTAINVMSGKSYEQEFELEQQRMAKPAPRSTPWGQTYREAPEILHGYDRKVKGDTASERLDMRAAVKADKFCK